MDKLSTDVSEEKKSCRCPLADILDGKTKQLVPLLGNWTLEKSGSIGRLDVN